jgi:biopolymer transport protein ExbD
MSIWRAAIFLFALAVAMDAQETGVPLHPADPAHPGPHDMIVKVARSETDASGTIEIGDRKFVNPEDILELARAKVAADPELRAVFYPIGHVPLEFAKPIIATLHQAGIMRMTVAMPEKSVTLPIARDAKATPPPGLQLDIRVVWSAADNTGVIQIDDRKFAKADEILELLQARVKAKPELRILIRANRDVRYEYLKQVMIVAGKAGVGKVTFSVVDGETTAP